MTVISPQKKRQRTSQIDAYYDIIQELLSEDSIQKFYYKRHLWQYLKDNHDLKCASSTFRRYISQHAEFQAYFDTFRGKSSRGPILRFETDPGEQAQIDWKENIRFVTSDGEVLMIHVFCFILSYSRYRIWHVSLSRSQAHVFSLLTECFEHIGSVPRTLVTDNMATVMDQSRTASSDGVVNTRFESFAKDFGFTVHPSQAYRPQTKGKVETTMKLIQELHAYNGQLTYEELIHKSSEINQRVNYDIHQGTGQIPLQLLTKEKDFLSPLPTQKIRNLYKVSQDIVTVNTAGMISFRGNHYSVPPEYIGQKLERQIEENHLHLYHNTCLVAVHPIKDQKINYRPEDYQSVARELWSHKSSEEIRQITHDNLKKIGDRYK